MAKKFFFFTLIAVVTLSTCFSFASFTSAATDYSGKLIKSGSSTSLYYAASDGKRYVFPNEKNFKTWFTDFSGVVTVSPEELASLPIGGNVLYRPGVLLVKIQTDPRIYAVSKNGVLRWIETEAIAKHFYGDQWHLLVDDIPDSFFVNYKIGTSIGSIDDYNPDQEINNVNSIEANINLSTANARHANTQKCGVVAVSSSYIRDCKGTIQDDINYDNVSGDPYIKSIYVINGGDDGYLDVGDKITITFSEAIDPKSINENLKADNNEIFDISYLSTGGVRVASSGVVTIGNIASFDMGSVDYPENFIVKLALSSTGKVLTITLTGGSDLEILEENFKSASQTGGVIKDLDGNKMKSDSSIANPTGTFGGVESNNPYIASVVVSNGGDAGYIDVGDKIIIHFNEPIDPESINSNLELGDYVNNVSYLNTGGIRVSSSGKVTVNNIMAFDMGSVDNSETFTVRLALDATGKILTITLTGGSDLEITNEDFNGASQTGGVVKDRDGNKMESNSSITDPTGTFGGNYYGEASNTYITKIEVSDGGDEGYIDVGDTIAITFNEPINPKSINDSLTAGSYVNNVLYPETGSVRISSAGEVIVSGITVFNIGSVAYSKNFIVKLALSSTGKVLTITLTSGGDVEITNEDFDGASQTGGTIKDLDGNAMKSDSSIADPVGTFGGTYNDGSDDTSDPYITAINAVNGGDAGYIDIGDSIVITFNESIDPESINVNLNEGSYVSGVSYSENGGVRVSSSGKITINNIASFDVGSVGSSETYTVKLALSSNGKILTVTLTSGGDVEITDEDFNDASQTGGIVKDLDGNEMNSDPTITKPTGTFGGSTGSNDSSGNPYITAINITNGDTAGYIDVGDTIAVTFNESIDPKSINNSIVKGGYVNNIPYSSTGGVSVFSAGALIIEKIAVFDVGSVGSLGTFSVRLALDSTGKILTITLTSGADVKITVDSISDATQTGGTIKDQSGNEMKNSGISRPKGSF